MPFASSSETGHQGKRFQVIKLEREIILLGYETIFSAQNTVVYHDARTIVVAGSYLTSVSETIGCFYVGDAAIYLVTNIH